MYEKMEAIGLEKWAGYKIHHLKRWFGVSRLTVPAYIGTFAITSSASKQRWFLGKDAVPFARTWVTPADLARLYLTVKYGHMTRRITTAQWQNFYQTHRSMPLWAEPVYMDFAYYLDIRSAYWSILKAVGWNVDYTPGKVLKINDPATVYDFPFPDNKMARNCLVSVGADGSRKMQFWTGEKITYVKTGNKLVNKMLYSLVCDVLNGVAHDAVNAGAVYSFTDGFIVPAHRREQVEAAVEAWGLPLGIKAEGECEVSGPGAYSFFGRKTTTKFNSQRPHTVKKINPVAVDWLRREFSMAARYNRINEPFDFEFFKKRVDKQKRYVKDA